VGFTVHTFGLRVRRLCQWRALPDAYRGFGVEHSDSSRYRPVHNQGLRSGGWGSRFTVSRQWRALPDACQCTPRGWGVGGGTRKVDIRLPRKGNSNSHGARPVHQTITIIKWIRTSGLSIKKSLSLGSGGWGSRFTLSDFGLEAQGPMFRDSGFGLRGSEPAVSNTGTTIRVLTLSGPMFQDLGFGIRISGCRTRILDSGFGFQGFGVQNQRCRTRGSRRGGVPRVWGLRLMV